MQLEEKPHKGEEGDPTYNIHEAFGVAALLAAVCVSTWSEGCCESC